MNLIVGCVNSSNQILLITGDLECLTLLYRDFGPDVFAELL